MSQLNIHVTENFEAALRRLMRMWNIRTKSAAVRRAVEVAARQAAQEQSGTSFRSWLGMAKRAPLNPEPRFSSHDDLWE